MLFARVTRGQPTSFFLTSYLFRYFILHIKFNLDERVKVMYTSLYTWENKDRKLPPTEIFSSLDIDSSYHS